MLYNYGNPYTNSSMNMYGGGNNYQPMSNVNSQNQQALNPFYQSVYPINNQRFSAFFVNDYSEVKNAIVSSDGSPSLFMMNDKDVFYIKKVGEDGRTILKSFEFKEFTDEDNMVDKKNVTQQNNQEIEIMKQEINQLKESMSALINALSNTNNNQSQNNSLQEQQHVKKGGNKNAKQYSTKDF